MGHIRNVVFDFGRVLGNFNKWVACQLLAAFTNTMGAEEIHRLLVGSELEIKLEKGEISEDEFGRQVIRLIGAEGHITPAKACLIWSDIFTPNPDIEPIVRSLIERKVPIAVLSTTNTVHFPMMMRLPVMAALKKYGAPFFLSHEMGFAKPDPRSYEAPLVSLGANAEETLFLDDLEVNVNGALAVGMVGERYSSEEHNAAYLNAIFTRHGLQ